MDKLKFENYWNIGDFQDEEMRQSLECIQANQIFPRKQLIREDENLQVITGHFWLCNMCLGLQ